MREREPAETPYWQFDWPIGNAPILGRRQPVSLRVHIADEAFSRRSDLLTLSQWRGTRTYIHAHPYILIPEITVTMQLTPVCDALGAIGHVTAARQHGMREHDIGRAQAWYYPADAIVILWECYLNEWCRGEFPGQDEALHVVWTGFERLLKERWPQARRILTPGWEPIYDAPVWHAVGLRRQGYAAFNSRAFVKPFSRTVT